MRYEVRKRSPVLAVSTSFCFLLFCLSFCLFSSSGFSSLSIMQLRHQVSNSLLIVLVLLLMESNYRQAIVIDGRGHLLGRLASVVAKTLLQGNDSHVCSLMTKSDWILSSSGRRVIVVRCEGINISGSFYRNKCEYHSN